MNPNFGGGQGGLRQRGGALNMKECMVKSLQSGELTLAGRGLRELPSEFKSLDSLDYDNKTWWEEVELTKLDLSNNELTELPKGMSTYPMLGGIHQLNLMQNKLSVLPSDVFSFQLLSRFIACDNNLTEIPLEIGSAMNLVELDLSGNPLKGLPESLGNLDHLSTLKLSKCSLTSLPQSIGGCRSLQLLDVSNNKISEIPDSLCQLNSLVNLIVSVNCISKLPELPQSKFLTRIDFRQNKLSSLPERINAPFATDITLSFNNITAIRFGDVPELATLDLRDNKLVCIDFVSAETTPKLCHLNVANNNVSHLDPGLGHLSELKVLSLEGNPLKSISRSVLTAGTAAIMKYLRGRQVDNTDPQQGTQLSTIARCADVSGNIDLSPDPTDRMSLRKGGGLSSLPTEIFASTTSIVSIKCCSQNFTQLPNELSGLTSLTSVDFSNNQICEIAIAPVMLPLLRSLTLKRNRLQSIPDFNQIQYLDVSANQLTVLPNMSKWISLHTLIAGDCCIQQFPCVPSGMNTLVLSGNKISHLPLELLAPLSNINTLDLSNNELQHVPPEIGCMDSLRSLLLTGNPLKTIRRAVLEKGTPNLLEYLRDKIPVPGSIPPNAPQGRNIRSF